MLLHDNICPSAVQGIDVLKLLREIIGKEVYRKDYFEIRIKSVQSAAELSGIIFGNKSNQIDFILKNRYN